VRYLFILLACVGLARAQEEAPSSFREVTRYLNPDGDFYLYLNSAQWGEKLLKMSEKLELLAQAVEPKQAAETKAIFAGVREILQESGLMQVKGLGMSSVLWQEGLYANRSVAYHGDAPVTAKLWQIAAGEAQRFEGLAMMPENTVLGFTGNLRLDLLFDFLSTLPSTEKALEELRQQWREKGRDLDAVMAGFAGDVTLIVTIDPEKRRQLPPHSIPEFGLLAAFDVRDHSLYELVAKDLERAPQSEPLELPGVQGLTVRGQERGPIRLQPTVAKSANRLYLASNPDVLTAALATDGRLADSAEFKRLHEGLPEQGNHLLFVSRAITAQIKQFVRKGLQAEVGPTGKAQVWAKHRQQLPKLHMHGVPLDGPALLDAALAKEEPPGVDVMRYLDALGDYQGCIVNVQQADAMVSYSNESVSMPARGLVSLGVAAAGIMIPRVAIRARNAQRANQHALRAHGMSKLRRLGTAIIAIAGEDRENRELPADFAAISKTGKLPATGEVWDCPGTPRRTFHVSETDYVYLGAKLIDWAADAHKRVILHSPAGAYEGKFVNFLFLDGHVETRPGNDPRAIVEQQGWIYGVREGERDAVKPPESYDFRLAEGQLVLLDVEDEREVGRAHPSEAFDMPDLQLTAVAPWGDLCWVGSSSGLFRYDAKARSWSRFAIARTDLDVPVDSLAIEGELLLVGYAAAKSARFNLETRTWLAAAVVPTASAAAPVSEAAPQAKVNVSMLLVAGLFVLLLAIAIIASRRRA
jgi:prepilin-type processing-associated H-X9-DG protein